MVPHELGSGLGDATELLVRAIGVFVPQAKQMGDPGRGIEDDHRFLLCKSPETRLVKVSVPADPASKPPNGSLRPSLDQQTQSFLDCGLFCPCSTALDCLPH